MRRLTAAQLAHWGVGPVKERRSRYRPEGYLSNGCIDCDAIQGWFPLHEDLVEFLSEGGTYEQLIVGRWQLIDHESRRPGDGELREVYVASGERVLRRPSIS